jgi:hypothetical protein
MMTTNSQSNKEYDPNEAPGGMQNPDGCWSMQKSLIFDRLANPIRSIVNGLSGPNLFWNRHKFMGSPVLDLQLKTWMKKELSISANLVEDNWPCFRRAVKETLQQRRTNAVNFIQAAFFGESQPFFSSAFGICS